MRHQNKATNTLALTATNTLALTATNTLVMVPLVALGSITPAFGASIAVEVQVVDKTNLRNMAGKDAVMFHLYLRDGTGKIRASFFGGHAKTCFSKVEAGKCYRIEGLKVRENIGDSANAAKYSLTTGSDAVVIQEIAPLQFDCPAHVPISSIEVCKGRVCIVGVVRVCHPVREIVRAADQQTVRVRDVELADDSGASTVVSFWEHRADREYAAGDVLRVTDLGVNFSRGLKLSSTVGTIVEQLEGTEAERLRQWVNEHARDVKAVSPEKVRKLQDLDSGGLVEVVVVGVRQDRKVAKKGADGKVSVSLLVDVDDGSRPVPC